MKKLNIKQNIKTFFKTNKLTATAYLSLVLIISLGAFLGITLARFFYQNIRESIFTTNNFYFKCDKMSEDNPTYYVSNWNGADAYTFIFNMNSIKNNKLKSNTDIAYKITYTCSDNALCSSTLDESDLSSVIYQSTNADSFNISISPNNNYTFVDGTEAWLKVEAESTSPYKATISAEFRIIVGHMGLSYEIKDKSNNPYLELRITNTLDYYVVETAFGSHNVGERIDAATYLTLTDAEKTKCTSAIVTINFDPSKIVLDMTSPAYLKGFDISNTSVSGISYINQMSFKVNALDSETVYFYKKDVSRDYSYPLVNSNSIIAVSFSE